MPYSYTNQVDRRVQIDRYRQMNLAANLGHTMMWTWLQEIKECDSPSRMTTLLFALQTVWFGRDGLWEALYSSQFSMLFDDPSLDHMFRKLAHDHLCYLNAGLETMHNSRHLQLRPSQRIGIRSEARAAAAHWDQFLTYFNAFMEQFTSDKS